MIADLHRVILNGVVCCALLLFCQRCLARQQADPDWTITILHSIGDENQSHTDTIKNVLLRDQGQQVLTCGLDGVVCLWDIESKSIIRRFVDLDSQIVWCMDMTSDERYLVAGGKGNQINVWDIESGDLVSKHDCASSVLSTTILNDDRSFLGADDRGFVSRWSLDKTEPVSEWRICGGDVTALAVAPDNSFFITGNNDGEVQLWELDQAPDQESEPECKREFAGLHTWVCCLKLSVDGSQLIGCDYSGNVANWDLQTGKMNWPKERVSDRVGWVEFLDEQWIIAVDSTDRFFRLQRESGEHTFSNISLQEIAGFALSPDRKTLWCGGNVAPFAWDIESGKRLFPHDDMIQSIQRINQVALHEKTLFIGSNKPPVVAWDLATDSLAFQIESPDSDDWKDMHMLETSDGIVLANEKTATLFDFDSGEALTSTKVSAMAFTVSPDGKKTLFLDKDTQGYYQKLDFDHTDSRVFDQADGVGIRAMRLLDDSRILVLNDDKQIQIQNLDNHVIIRHAAAGNYSDVLDATSMAIAFQLPGGFPAIHYAQNAISSEIDEASFEQLLDDLESNDYLVRETATTRLIRGGPDIGRQIRLFTTGSIEQAVRIERIQKLIDEGQLPDLQNPLNLIDPCDQTIEAVCFNRTSEFMLASARTGWKSELHIYTLRHDGIHLVAKKPLRSRATLIRRSLENDAIFVIAYGGGAVDIIEIEHVPLSKSID